MHTGLRACTEPLLPGPPTRQFVRLLRDHVTLYRLEETAVARERGLPWAQLHCLAEFADAPELSAKELTLRLGLSHSRLSHVLESLEAHEMISRRINPNDRRIIMVDLAPKGRAVVETLETGLGHRYEQALRALPPEATEAAMTVLARALEAVRPARRAPESRTRAD